MKLTVMVSVLVNDLLSCIWVIIIRIKQRLTKLPLRRMMNKDLGEGF